MLANQILLAIIGLSAGVLVAGGLFGFIVSLGVVSDFADRTHTGKYVLLYEDAVIVGGILGNLMYVYNVSLTGGTVMLGIFGLFAGVFVGGWAMALAEVLNVFPIFVRRIKILKAVPYIILSTAVGKGIGSIIYFFFEW